MEITWDDVYEEFCQMYGDKYGMYSGTFAEYIIENYEVKTKEDETHRKQNNPS